MKKVIISNVLAFAMVVVPFAGIAQAQAATSYVFSNYLTVGSTGADVTALQSWLVASGFLTMPAGVSMGYFGKLTKAAVVSYQASVGLPATGYVGPLTVAKLNGGAVAAAPAPVGFTCPVGWTCSAPAAANPAAPVSMNGTDGSISVSQSSYVSSGIMVKKGETKDVVAVRLQATAGPVSLSRLDVHFNIRPWLVFNQVTLHDSAGHVIATKSISSINDATEVTSNNDYMVRFDGLSYTVTPGTNVDLVVGASVLASSDKITGQSVSVAIPAGAIRTINGKGYTDSVGGTVSLGSVGNGGNTFTFAATSASTADIRTGISPASSPITRSQAISTTQTTNSVVLGIYRLQSQNQDSTLNNINFVIHTGKIFGASNEFSNVRLMDGSTSYGANGAIVNSGNNGTVSFVLTPGIALTKDQWHDLTLVADVAATSTTVTASSTLTASSISGVDANFSALTVSNASDQTTSDVILTTNSVSVTNIAVNLGAGVPIVASGPVVRFPNATYSFTLTNNSSNDLYVPADPALALATSTNPTDSSNASTTITSLQPLTSVSGDLASSTARSYKLASGGGTRTFVYTAVIQKASNAATTQSLSITAINYYATAAMTDTVNTINSGLTQLFLQAGF